MQWNKSTSSASKIGIQPLSISPKKKSVTFMALGFLRKFVALGIFCRIKCLAKSFAELCNFWNLREIGQSPLIWVISSCIWMVEFPMIHLNSRGLNVVFPKWLDFCIIFPVSVGKAGFVLHMQPLHGTVFCWSHKTLHAMFYSSGGGLLATKSHFSSTLVLHGAQFKSSIAGTMCMQN